MYWDTSCILKLYAQESDSELWQVAATDSADPIVSSALIEAELAYAFRQKEQRGDLKCGASTKLMAMFRRDMDDGRFHLFPVGADVLARSVGIAELCYQASPIVSLRTLDGLHLATALLLKCTHISTVDLRMKAAARLLKLAVS